MRQRRHPLQVSTFPFLAVLLCTMGSLILLLLVIDRRARVVARAKALRAATALAAEDDRARARRQAELERRQQELHAQLRKQDQEVLTQALAVRDKSTATAEGLRRDQAQAQKLQEQFEAESARLAQGQNDVQARQAEAARTADQTREAQRDLARLGGDLARLERTLADLKEARRRDEHKHSLVPYRGRQGDDRRPLYVECGDGSVIFHPDRTTLAGLQMTLGGVRTEVEKRLARRTAATPTKAKGETPYLLLLVRPNGVGTYYKVLSALEGMKIDFGYEFVESDWVLDFPEKEDAAVQPWMTAGPAPGAPGHAAPASTRHGDGPNPSPFKGGTADVSASGRGGPVRPGGSAAAGVRFGGPLVAQTHPGTPGNPGAAGGALGPVMPGGTGTGSPAVSMSDGQDNRPFNPATGSAGGRRMDSPSGTPHGSAARPSIQGGGGPGQPLEDPLQLPQQAGSTVPTVAGTGEVNLPRSGGASPARPAPGESRSPGTSGESGSPVSSPGQPSVGPGTAPASAPAMGSPTAAGIRSAATAAPGGARSPAPSAGSAGQTAAGGSGGEPSSDTPASEGRPILPPVLPGRAPPTPPASERPRVFGDRNWVLSLECTADGVTVYPGGRRIPAAALAPAGDNPLLKVVQALIARRQAMVRPGEPPYRPIVRFLVHPDGLRTYYLAYPALESLQVSMVRENVRPERKDDH